MTEPLLPKGGCIAVVAPSGIHQKQRLLDGMTIIRNRGYTLQEIGTDNAHHRYLAATDEHRLAALITALNSEETDAVWVTRGGYGLTRLLGHLPPKLPKKPIIGFSDTTALFCATHQQLNVVHGPVIHSLSSTSSTAIDHLFSLLEGRPLIPWQGTTWVAGNVTAPVVGGNLALIAALCGTPHQLSADGKILLLEDINEAPYRIDRMLTQIIAAGVLNGVVGIGFGDFTGCHPPVHTAYSLAEILAESVAHLNVPVIGNLPFGHAENNFAFLWNQPATINNGELAF